MVIDPNPLSVELEDEPGPRCWTVIDITNHMSYDILLGPAVFDDVMVKMLFIDVKGNVDVIYQIFQRDAAVQDSVSAAGHPLIVIPFEDDV